MRAPRVIFDIVLLALYLVAANPALTGVPFHEYLGAGIFVLMVAHVVVSYGVGDAAAFFGLLCDWLLFLGPIACPIRQGAVGRPARACCSARTRGSGGVSSSGSAGGKKG